MRLLLIRHAQTTSNVLHLLDTAEPGAALTEVGRHKLQDSWALFAMSRLTY
jgi:broad specificity phosphatase PhoE